MATPTSTTKILTVDDEEALVELIVDILESRNYQVQSATKWMDAIDALSHNKPDLVLLDLKMPTVHGTSILEFIRSEGFEIPVIVVSGFVTDAVTKELYAQGVQGVVKKPFKAQALLEEVERVLAEFALQAAPEEDSDPKSAMDALYNRAPESPSEPGQSESKPTVDALYEALADQPEEKAEAAANAEGDILSVLQKSSEEKKEKTVRSRKDLLRNVFMFFPAHSL